LKEVIEIARSQVTLLMAMLANLILLPSLLISLQDTISNDKVLKKPKIEILDH
jgi:hypothetical protein